MREKRERFFIPVNLSNLIISNNNFYLLCAGSVSSMLQTLLNFIKSKAPSTENAPIVHYSPKLPYRVKSSPILHMKNQGTEKLNNLCKITQLLKWSNQVPIPGLSDSKDPCTEPLNQQLHASQTSMCTESPGNLAKMKTFSQSGVEPNILHS